MLYLLKALVPRSNGLSFGGVRPPPGPPVWPTSNHFLKEMSITLIYSYMNHVIKILEIKHLSKNGEVLWEAFNLTNMLHIQGEEFILSAVFSGGVANTYIPTYYYFGLDNRTSIAAADTLAVTTLTEPNTYGYARARVSSTGKFTVSTAMTGHNLASSPIVAFDAIGGSWGPVRNLFVATTAGNGGYLIASVPLIITTTLLDGEQLTAKIGLGLKDC